MFVYYIQASLFYRCIFIGCTHILQNSLVGEILRAQDESSRIIGAICAGPKAFVAHNVAKEKLVTSYPAMQSDMEGAGNFILCIVPANYC